MSIDRNDLEEYLLTRLEKISDELSARGIKNEMSMDEREVPGLLVFTAGAGAMFLTLADEM